MRLFMTVMMLLTISLPSYGEELWACTGFKSSRDDSGSVYSPFLLRSYSDVYEWTSDLGSKKIKKVAESGAGNPYDIYIDIGANSYRNAYYIKSDENKLEIRQLIWGGYFMQANCVSQ